MTSAALCLALAIYYEARSEPFDGQLAIAEVVVNRVESDRYPDTPCDVVMQGGTHRHKCQFSFYCDGKPERPGDMIAWHKAKDLARWVLAEQVSLGLTATHYHADYVEPFWADHYTYLGRIGGHLFYEQSN
jgi:spore germination cell wall hydrolase CwlJ-like protein